jgi:hypothetical protein
MPIQELNKTHLDVRLGGGFCFGGFVRSMDDVCTQNTESVYCPCVHKNKLTQYQPNRRGVVAELLSE